MKNNQYQIKLWVYQALLSVVKQTITTCANSKSVDNHQFYITFKTDDIYVEMPEYLKEEYPELITIIIENIFGDIEVIENKEHMADGFYIELSFYGKNEKIFIPWHTITQFIEPTNQISFNLEYVGDPITNNKLSHKMLREEISEENYEDKIINFPFNKD